MKMPLVALPPERLVPMPELFWHPSRLHGQAHVSRVMVHAIRLVEVTGQHELGPQLWAAVFLHDLARRHDGVCHQHGPDAAQRLRDDPELQKRLAEVGMAVADHQSIEAAVTAHSAPKEVSREHAHWRLIALLKDADALDRVRIDDLDPRFLRYPESQAMTGFAQDLFDRTNGRIATGADHFSGLWRAAWS